MDRFSTLSVVTDTIRGILVHVAQGIEADAVNRMAKLGGGIIAATIDAAGARRLGLSFMCNTWPVAGLPTYLCAVEAAACAGTGISAADRALTLRTLGNPQARAGDLVMPGHIVPYLVGDLNRQTLTLPEAAQALAGRSVSLAWADILDDEGNVAAGAYCARLAIREGLPLVTLAAPAGAGAVRRPAVAA